MIREENGIVRVDSHECVSIHLKANYFKYWQLLWKFVFLPMRQNCPNFSGAEKILYCLRLRQLTRDVKSDVRTQIQK